MAMTKKDAVRHLKELRSTRQTLHDEIARKRWRPSEKAMAQASYAMATEALTIAIDMLEAAVLAEASEKSEATCTQQQ